MKKLIYKLFVLALIFVGLLISLYKLYVWFYVFRITF